MTTNSIASAEGTTSASSTSLGNDSSAPVVELTTPFDHITFLGYTHIMLAFASQSPDTTTLRRALKRVLERAPFVGGTVQAIVLPPPSAAPNMLGQPSGFHRIGAPYEEVDTIFAVHDLRDATAENGGLDFAQWLASGAPVRPLTRYCAAPPALVPPPAPVARIRLTIVNGGCFISTSWHHAALDGHGLARVVQAWAAECHTTGGADTVDFSRMGGPAALEQFEALPLDAHDLEHDLRILHRAYIQAPPQSAPFPPQVPEATTAFYFPSAALAELKTAASSDLPPGAWVSTNDALTALIWTRVSRAIGRDAGVNVAMNVRTRFDPPVKETYVGNAVYFVRALPLVEDGVKGEDESKPELELDLSKAAHAVHTAVRSLTPQHLDSVAKIVSARTPILEAHAHPEGPVAVSSWHAQSFHSFDWGAETFPPAATTDLAASPGTSPISPTTSSVKPGFCMRVLAPKFFRPRLCIIMPARPGGMDVVIGLKAEHMRRLLEDDVWKRYARRESGWPQ